MNIISYIRAYLTGPTLYRIYRQARLGQGYVASEQYNGNAGERYGGMVMSCISALWSFGIYTSPFILTSLYRRDMFTPNGAVTISKFLVGVCVLYVVSMNIRALGRVTNPTYREFLETLNSALQDFNVENKKKIQLYDFEFSSWPVEFSMKGRSRGHKQMFLAPRVESAIWEMPLIVMSWLMVNSFGIKLVYPGSIGFMKAALAEPLQTGREKWTLEKKAVRYKLETADDNHIDAMFFDRRTSSDSSNSSTENGETLVISCEGNAGFYEIGVLSTPMDAGYSVLGWNHPGFGGSTGTPFPPQETNAVDAVIQFAILKLGFTPNQIVLHGWSIGGFSASWVAMNYPDVKALILDATFDDLLPLAIPRMPEVMEPLVKTGVSRFIDLNVAEQVNTYNGPIKLIRRSQDEMISTEPGKLSSNRGNDLLRKILLRRYPNLFADENVQTLLNQYLASEESTRKDIFTQFDVDDTLHAIVAASVEEAGGTFPCKLGKDVPLQTKQQLALYLASKYMVDFDSTHCIPLPVRYFSLPWDSSRKAEESFVKL